MNIRPQLTHFNTAERLTFAYGLFTAAYILLFFNRIEQPGNLLLLRLLFFAALFLLRFLSEKFQKTGINFIRYLFPFALVSHWYPETYFLNHEVIIPNLDGFFDNLDKMLFGCAPAIEFSRIFPQSIISEIMYFGYFSYFVIFVLLFTCIYFKKREVAEQSIFLCLCSFFIFYLIFIFVPVSGPQFYYPSPENQVPEGHVFYSLMRYIQSSGEQPTGAFPSSHVGLTMIATYLMFKHLRKIFYFVLPAAIILTASTVYIKAHYLVDVLASFAFTPMIYLVSKKVFSVKYPP